MREPSPISRRQLAGQAGLAAVPAPLYVSARALGREDRPRRGSDRSSESVGAVSMQVLPDLLRDRGTEKGRRLPRIRRWPFLPMVSFFHKGSLVGR